MQFRLRSLGNFGLFTRRAIFVWPWNENSRTKQKQQTNGNRAIGLVYRTDTNSRGFWLVERTFGWKNLYAQELRFDIILQHDWPIEQCLLHIRVFFGGKTKRPCFDLFIYWLIKQITNAYRNYFSSCTKIALIFQLVENSTGVVWASLSKCKVVVIVFVMWFPDLIINQSINR